MFTFTKKNDKIAKCFYDHFEHVEESLENLEKFFEVLFSEKPDRNMLESLKTAIDNDEGAADQDLRRVVDAMSGAFLPTTRKNLISIVQSTDEVANNCQNIARQIFHEKIVFPEATHHDLLQMIKITRGQIKLLYTAIDKVLGDFGDLIKDKSILDDIRGEESKVDSIEALLHTRIFEMDITLAEKIYFKDLLEKIGDLSDQIEDISDQIHVMLVEREA